MKWIALVVMLFAPGSWAQTQCCMDNAIAFPEAEGFGRYSIGGRGGTVYTVNTLSDCDGGTVGGITDCADGVMSLRKCAAGSGPRTCVFSVSGTIEIHADGIRVESPYLTIAGQTSPGGIQLKRADGFLAGSPLIGILAPHVQIRYMRFRSGVGCDSYTSYNSGGTNSCTPSTGKGYTLGADNVAIVSDSASPDEPHDVIIDHCSFYWSTDESIDMWNGANPTPANNNSRTPDVTIQDSLISPQLDLGVDANQYGMPIILGGSERLTMLRNLATDFYFRWPDHTGYGLVDFVNNVSVSGPPGYSGTGGYVFRPGPDAGCGSTTSWAHDPPPVLNARSNWGAHGWTASSGLKVLLYMLCANESIWDDGGNHVESYTWLTQYTEGGGVGGTDSQASSEFPVPHLVHPTALSASAAHDLVLATAGASKRLTCDGDWVGNRDSLDSAAVTRATNKTYSFIHHPSEAGGWPDLATGAPSPCADTDADGMPDAFESRYGVSDATADDDGDRFTNLEEYLNGTVPK